MNLGRVIGSLWATRKAEAFTGVPLLVVQPIGGDEKPLGKPLVAADTVGAGPGETVFYITAREAVLGLTGDIDALAPVDATIIGIVDFLDGKEK